MEFGVWSLIPPVLTIALALITKNVFISLLIGILTGNLVLNHFAVFTGLNAGIYSILDTMTESNTLIIGSVLITAAVIHLAEKSGGIEGFVNVVVKRKGLIKSKRGANLFTWLLGLVVFTSGTLSCMVTGSVSRPVNDALKVPHEKAAFIVHTTSTPWCVLFPFSGWLAAMAGYLVTGGVPEDQSVSVLFQSLFMNFYCILAILLVFVLAVTQKDFGPMLKAEKRAASTGELDDPNHAKENSDTSSAVSGQKPRAINLLLPVGTLIAVMFAALIITGNGNLMNGSGMKALIWAVVVALLVASVLCVVEKVFTPTQVIDEIFKGTNSADRIVGAKEVITKLAGSRCMTVVSTHDFELCSITDKDQTPAVNYHFQEYYEGDELRFDYKIRDGRCTTTNARAILRMAGFEV